MSLESKIETLALAVERLASIMTGGNAPMPTSVTPPAPPAPAAPVAPVTSTAPPMPPPPSFLTMTLPDPAAPAAPFTDAKGLMDYTMSSYQILGTERGSLIQNVITSLGCEKMNDLKPEHYSAYYQGVEALKKS